MAAASGFVLRAQRRENGLTQVVLAEAAGLSEAAVSLLERGKRQPSLDVAFRLSATPGLEADALARATTGRLAEG